jgi:hypothetical protein
VDTLIVHGATKVVALSMLALPMPGLHAHIPAQKTRAFTENYTGTLKCTSNTSKDICLASSMRKSREPIPELQCFTTAAAPRLIPTKPPQHEPPQHQLYHVPQ